MRYQVILAKQVQKQLDRLHDDGQRRVLERLSELEGNPRPADVKKLRACFENAFFILTRAV
jgi:mRNA-degrading endonuclease RelE of RelBE toxin-antitoxin system